MTTASNKSAAAKAEAVENAAPVAFEHEGDEWHILPSTEWTFGALESFEAGHVAAFLLAVIPEEHHEKLRALRVGQLQGLVLAAQKAAGIPGN